MTITELKEAFAKVFGTEADATFFSPGRINLIGNTLTTTEVTYFLQLSLLEHMVQLVNVMINFYVFTQLTLMI